MLHDSHFHFFVDEKKFKYDFLFSLKEAIKNDITDFCLVSTNIEDFKKNLDFIKNNIRELKDLGLNTFRTFAGFHPDNYKEYLTTNNDSNLNALSNLLEKEKQTNNLAYICGIGEIGIDLHWNKKDTLEDQINVFKGQIKIAQKYNLPICIHSRDAFEETLNVLKEYTNLKLLWHCFTLNAEETNKVLQVLEKECNHNLYIGVNNIATYNSGKYILNSLKLIHKDRILLETDAPFLKPRKFNFEFNNPMGVLNVFDYLNMHLGISKKNFKENFISLFNF